MNNYQQLKQFLDNKVNLYNTPGFIKNDPIQIPHRFSKLQDIEIMAFWTAMLSWGNRTTIINKCTELSSLMDGAPHDFVVNHQSKDLERFKDFKHRTFNLTDTLYFLSFFKHYYKKHDSLEIAFSSAIESADDNVAKGLIHFHELFFNLENAPERTKKHVATPLRKSTCKRICMFLRWMVRNDKKGVDFGLWQSIKMSQLFCPLDVHVERVARKLNLIQRKQRDWLTTIELTEALRHFDKHDPVKYDFALFGLGVEEKY